jgi:phosphotransferase system HPr (HPr) family protein
MIASADVTVTNPSGLHARPAAELSRLAASLASSVRLRTSDRTVDAASVLSVMAAAVKPGQTVTVLCEGESAQDDLDVLVEAITSGLGE